MVFASYVVNLSPWTQKRMPAGSDADKPKKKKNYGLPCVPGDSPGLNSDVNIGRKSTCWISTVTLGGPPWNWMDFNTGCHTKYAMTRNGRSGWPNRALRNYDFGTTNGAKIPKASCLRSGTHYSAEPVARAWKGKTKIADLYRPNPIKSWMRPSPRPSPHSFLAGRGSRSAGLEDRTASSARLAIIWVPCICLAARESEVEVTKLGARP